MGKMSKQNKNPTRKEGWKFEDDYTGAWKYSCDAQIDENGWITAGVPDKPDPRKKGPRMIKEQIPPWTRPAQDNPDVDATTLDEDTDY